MPEGHTVHRLARLFTDLFAGQQVAVSSPQGRFALGAARLDGLVMARTEAYGKQMFAGFACGPALAANTAATGLPAADAAPLLWLRVHLGLYGSWTFASDGTAAVTHAIGAPRRRFAESVQDGALAEVWPPAPRGQVRVRLLGEHVVADLTGPTACEVIDASARQAVLNRLGPDPIRSDAGAQERFITRVRKSRVSIGVQLMDQAVVAGVGNIYRAEVLFRAGINPALPGTQVPESQLAALWADLVVLMRDGAATGRIVTTRPSDRGRGHELGLVTGARARQNTDSEPGAIPASELFYVYHRDGLACRVCGTPIARRTVAGRNLFWCSNCQA